MIVDFEKMLEETRNAQSYKLQKISMDLIKQIQIMLKKEKINKAQLGIKSGLSKAYITRLMRGILNPTIKSLLKIADVLGAVNLAKYNHYLPKELSGGMKQRGAIARALSIEPELLLMDEPFANLDFPLRLDLIKLLSKIFAKKRMGGVFVTHDTREAVLLGDKIVIMKDNPGRIESSIEITIPKKDRYLESEKISQYNKLLNHYLCRNMGKKHMHKSCRLLDNMNFSCESIIFDKE